MKNYGGKSSFFGPIQTLKCPDDNSLIKEQLNSEGNNQVLIVDAEGVNTVALLGDLIAEAGIKNNWSGIVINGYIRDVDIIRTLDIGVQALVAYPIKSEKRGLGELGIEISFGGNRDTIPSASEKKSPSNKSIILSHLFLKASILS